MPKKNTPTDKHRQTSKNTESPASAKKQPVAESVETPSEKPAKASKLRLPSAI